MNDTRIRYCSCGHPMDWHERYNRSTQCTECSCPRPKNETAQCFAIAWAIIIFGTMFLLAVSAVLS